MYKVTYCRQQTIFDKENKGEQCRIVERVTDKVGTDICDVCTFEQSGAWPAREKGVEQVYTYDMPDGGLCLVSDVDSRNGC